MAITDGTKAVTKIEEKPESRWPILPSGGKTKRRYRRENAATAARILARIREAAADIAELYPAYRKREEQASVDELTKLLESAEQSAVALLAFIGDDLALDARTAEEPEQAAA